MIGIDLAYNLHSAYGNWFPGIKPLVIKVVSIPLEALGYGYAMCDALGHGQDHESESFAVCSARAHPKRTAALLVRANGALSLFSELWRTLFESDDLVCGRFQCLQV